MAIAVAGVVALPEIAAASPLVTARDVVESPLVQRINSVRAARGLPRLRVVAPLTKAATRHANSMAGAGYFSHDLFTPRSSSTWTPFGTWIRWHYPGPGYSSWSAGENIAWSSPDASARQVVRMWMNSPPHRRNLLTRGWRQVGVAAVHVVNASGAFDGRGDVTIVVAEFGRRS